MEMQVHAKILAIAASFAICPSLCAQSVSRLSVSSLQAESNADSFESAISADGRFCAFVSDAWNLDGAVVGRHVYRRDRRSLQTEIVSVSQLGAPGQLPSTEPAISANGRWIAFTSLEPLVLPDASVGHTDVYLRDVDAGTTELITWNSGSTVAGNYASGSPSISDDGRLVVFHSYSINLVPGDNNSRPDIFLRDRVGDTTIRVNPGIGGTECNGDSLNPCISADGSTIAFESNATNLVPGTLTSVWQIYIYTVATGAVTSATNDPNVVGVVGNGHSGKPSLSADGRFVAFETLATNFVQPLDTYTNWDCIRFDRMSQVYVPVNLTITGGFPSNGHSVRPRISHDGNSVLFTSGAGDLVPGGANGFQAAYVTDLASGSRVLVSKPPTAQYPTYHAEGGGIAGDAEVVTFTTLASDLVPGDTNGRADVFAYAKPLPHVTSYCAPKPNSEGCTPQIHAWRPLALSGADDCYLVATQELNQRAGLMIWGTTQATFPLGGGTLCVQPLKRTPGHGAGGSSSGIDCTGVLMYRFTIAYAIAQGLQPGNTVCAQFWSRDPGFAQPNNIALTAGLELTVQP